MNLANEINALINECEEKVSQYEKPLDDNNDLGGNADLDALYLLEILFMFRSICQLMALATQSGKIKVYKTNIPEMIGKIGEAMQDKLGLGYSDKLLDLLKKEKDNEG